ncbi:response regulator transcription factor [Dehalococcoidia bacterium]|nr:response regulator transcription factor [Dehalococcoidia bacterium]
MSKIRVFIADDHTLFRESLRSLLDDAEDIEVVGEVADGIEAVARVRELQPDVALMDIAMPNVNGLEATRQIRRRNPSVKVLTLTMYETEQFIFEMLRAGASGYILKSASGRELISAIQAVSQDDAYLYPSITRKVLDDYLEKIKAEGKGNGRERLTSRECEILRLIAEGKTNKEIARLLMISVPTVQTHRLNLMKKLKLHDRVELVRYAIREGLIVP